MKESLSDFNEFRSEMNKEIHASDHLGMKRFFLRSITRRIRTARSRGRPRNYWDLWNQQVV